MGKRLTLKQIEKSGWLEFVKWAIANNMFPQHMNEVTVLGWKNHLATLKILSFIEKDMYSNYPKRKLKMVGLRKQTGECK